MAIRRSFVILLAAAALAVPAVCLAQSERGSITGVVQDTSKAAIPGVSVKVINTATNAATDVVSSESGDYSAANLPPGPYRIEAASHRAGTRPATDLEEMARQGLVRRAPGVSPPPRLVRDRGVGGSNPLAPTKNTRN